MGLKYLLHAGCGSKLNGAPREFAAYKETRLDCNPIVEPDILASIVAMPMITDDSFDAVYCSHTLEHLFAHEVAMALGEFNRVLKPGGKVLLRVPDLQAIGGKIALDKADEVIYMNPNVGAVTPLDMIYGHRVAVQSGHRFMAHKTGFTASVLKRALIAAGFVDVETERGMGQDQYDLRAIALKGDANASQEPEAEGLSELEVRAPLDQTARV